MNLKYFIFLLFFSYTANSQELNCQVKVNFQQITNVSTQIFKTLETSLNEFMNKTKWTDTDYQNHEKINCSMLFIITSFDNNNFSGTLQVQSSRPIFNSIYSSPVFNFNDKDISFRYVEFENLFFNPNGFDSNLVSLMAFYSYMILGIDADTFQNQGGTSYYELAQNVLNNAQSGGFRGWSQSDGNQNRFFLVTDLLTSTFSPFREALYEYHTLALDTMATDIKASKEKIKSAIATLSKIHRVRPNAFLTRVFFDAKADELVSIYSGGPQVSITDLIENLNTISPLNASKWGAIK